MITAHDASDEFAGDPRVEYQELHLSNVRPVQGVHPDQNLRDSASISMRSIGGNETITVPAVSLLAAAPASTLGHRSYSAPISSTTSPRPRATGLRDEHGIQTGINRDMFHGMMHNNGYGYNAGNAMAAQHAAHPIDQSYPASLSSTTSIEPRPHATGHRDEHDSHIGINRDTHSGMIHGYGYNADSAMAANRLGTHPLEHSYHASISPPPTAASYAPTAGHSDACGTHVGIYRDTLGDMIHGYDHGYNHVNATATKHLCAHPLAQLDVLVDLLTSKAATTTLLPDGINGTIFDGINGTVFDGINGTILDGINGTILDGINRAPIPIF